MRLQDALLMLDPTERAALRTRRSIVIDPQKRIDEIEQTARALIAETDLRHSRLPTESRMLLERLAAAGGVLANAAHDPGADVLCELGITYRGRPHESTTRAGTGKRVAPHALVLPSAFLVQVPATQGEEPRSLRVCLGMVEHDVLAPMVLTVLGKPLAVSGPLALQEVWEVLSQQGAYEARVRELPTAEARLLDAIERAGGEVNTAELLAFDQTPGLYKTATGVSVQKRGAPFMLQRRGMLFPWGVDRFVLPAEVARVVGASRQAERAARRAQILNTLRADDHTPTRARFAKDPSLSAAMTLALLRYWDIGMRDDAAVPRHALRRIAERVGEREEVVTLYAALARASGLGRLLAAGLPVPGSLTLLSVADLGRTLSSTWMRGGVWDETRTESEVLRAGPSERASTASSVLRTLATEGLTALAADRWVPVDLVVRYAMEDPRAHGAARSLERLHRERPDMYRARAEDVLRAVITESAHALGMVDLSDDATAVRVARRASRVATVGAGVTRTTLSVPASVALHQLLALTDFAEPDGMMPDANALALSLGVNAIARARARGIDAHDVGQRLAVLRLGEPAPPAVRELLGGLHTVRAAGFLPVSGAIRVDDPAVRAEILADPSLRKLMSETDAGAYLLVRPDVDIARVQARLSRLGVRMDMIERRTASDSGMQAVSADQTAPQQVVSGATVPTTNTRAKAG